MVPLRWNSPNPQPTSARTRFPGRSKKASLVAIAKVVCGRLSSTFGAGSTIRRQALTKDEARQIAGGLRAGTRHEAANLCVADGRAETVGLSYNGVARHDEPLSIDSHTIVSILGVPVDILHTEAVGKRTAQALSARETVEPGLERRIRKSAVVTRDQLVWHQYRRQAKRKGCQTDESAHRGLPRSVPRV